MESTEQGLPRLSGISLLVLDDDPSIVRGLTRVLRGLGAEVTGVGSLREARLSLKTLSPDAVLADRQAFMGAIDRYIQGVLNATEDEAPLAARMSPNTSSRALPRATGLSAFKKLPRPL